MNVLKHILLEYQPRKDMMFYGIEPHLLVLFTTFE